MTSVPVDEIATALLSVPIPPTLRDAGTARRVARSINCLHRLVPSSQILLAADYPLARESGVASTLDGLERHAGFDDADRRAIETGNPRRLFPRLSGAR